MMRAIHWVVACVAVLVATTGQLHAAIITFTDRSAWEVAVGSFTLVDFNGIVPDHNIGVSGPFDAGPFTISAAGPFSSDNGIEAYDPNPTDIQSAGQDRNIDGTTYYSGDTDAGTVVTLAFDNPVFAFGFDYTSFNDGTPDDSFNVNGSIFLFPSSADFSD